MKILCLGNVAYDITLPMEDYPVENVKYRLTNRVECGGGQASNCAYLLAKWGMNVAFAGVVGNDYYGELIRKEFKDMRVDTTYLQVSNKFHTTTSTIIANTKNGSRTVLGYRSPDIKMDKVDINFEPDVILLDGQEPEMANYVLDKFPNAISVIDAGRTYDEIVELAKRVNYLVCSKDFAEEITGIDINYDDPITLIELYKAMETRFSNKIVVTLEDKGCLYKDDTIKLMPSIKVTAVDSTGAGDIFHGAFVYGIANGLPYEEVLKLSNIAGGLSVTKIGGRFSIPSLQELEAVYNETE